MNFIRNFNSTRQVQNRILQVLRIQKINVSILLFIYSKLHWLLLFVFPLSHYFLYFLAMKTALPV